MGNFAILACENMRTHCSGAYTCFGLYREGKKGYDIYQGTDARMVAYLYCSYCLDQAKRFDHNAEDFRKEGVTTIHFSNCILTCRPKHTEEIRKYWLEQGFKVIESAHG